MSRESRTVLDLMLWKEENEYFCSNYLLFEMSILLNNNFLTSFVITFNFKCVCN